MPGEAGDEFDFFLSRRGSVAAVAREVESVLAERAYKVFVQDYDIPIGASFIEAMHEAIKNARDLVILFTRDYEASPYTRKEFTSFEAERYHGGQDRHIVVLRCEDVPLRGLLADNVYQDLVGVTDPEERRRLIIAAAERRSSAQRPQQRRGRTFVGVPPRIAGFTGRADALDRLDAILTRDKPAAVTQVGRAAVQGMGGVGKTSLAVEYAHRFRNLYDGVWWCPAETRSGVLTNLAALAAEFEVAPAEEADVEKAAKAALRRLAEQREIWLLVYDNVSVPKEIADLLPAGGARVLITSRFSDWSEWADEVSLDVLPIEEAMALLQARGGRRDEAGARTLAGTLGQLPLALDHAAATCKRAQMSFAAYATKASSLIASAPRSAGYPRSIAATFDLAIDDAVRQCPEAEALMAFLAQCAPERIPMTLVEGAIEDDAERLQALAALAEVSLVKHDPFADGTPALSVHRLVQTVARARSQSQGTAENIIDRLNARMAAIYPNDATGHSILSPSSAQLLPHLLTRSRSSWPRAAVRMTVQGRSPSLFETFRAKISRSTVGSRSSAASERQITAMFCDLVGTTGLSERLENAHFLEVIGAFRSACDEAISRFGGFIATEAGDSVLACFGYPDTRQDDAARAIRAGLDLIQILAARPLSEEIAPEVRVGIATGPAIVGDAIERQGVPYRIVVGDALNLAAGMQGMAVKNGIAISESTWRLAGKEFEYDETEEFHLKGSSRRVRAFRVLQRSK
jgi:class 3 adenylate cyclase